MAQKHYQNDYKKLMGLDQSRTASQKLLDRVIGKRQSTLTAVKVENDQPTKKVKKEVQENREIKPEDAIQKVLKSYSMRNNLLKMQKCLQILTKMLDSQQTVKSLSKDKITEIVICLLNYKSFLHGSLGELINFTQLQLKVFSLLSNLITQQTLQEGRNLQEKLSLQIEVLNLITDDNFNFCKSISSLKAKILKIYQQSSPPEQRDEPTIKKEASHQDKKLDEIPLHEFVQQFIFPKLLVLPNLHLEWSRSGVTNLLKQFIAQYKQKLQKPKHFLVEYNKFIQNKKNVNETATHDIMGKKGVSGGSYTVMEQQDATNAWCKRQ